MSRIDKRKQVRKGRELSSRWPGMSGSIESVNRGPAHWGNSESFGMAGAGCGAAGTKADVGAQLPKGTRAYAEGQELRSWFVDNPGP